MGEDTRQTFLARSKVMSSLRQHMAQADFLEVETPMLHPIPGWRVGQTLRHTPQCAGHGNVPAYCSRAVPEEFWLWVVSERVFEINRNFRNEGVSPRHNPEFTMMEFTSLHRLPVADGLH